MSFTTISDVFCKTYFLFLDKDILVKLSPEGTIILPDSDVYNSYLKINAFSHYFAEQTPSQNQSNSLHILYTAAALKPDTVPPKDFSFIPLRQFFYETPDYLSALAARARGLLNWRLSMSFCSSCGHELADDEKLSAKNCTHCKKQYFPRIEPCIIVLVSRGSDILLVKHKDKIQHIHACIAGFIETGETVEQAVKREVKEEVGLEITNIRYAGSQSWPFPDQLMLAWRAEYKEGEIKVQEDEIAEANWYNRNDLPVIPPPGSIAYRLITGQFD